MQTRMLRVEIQLVTYYVEREFEIVETLICFHCVCIASQAGLGCLQRICR